MTTMKLERLLELEVLQNEDIEMPGTVEGDILISPTSGGTFRGEKLNGTVVPAGMGITGTWGGDNDIRTTLLLRTDDGQDILMDMNAILNIEPEVEDRLLRGESVDPDSYYYKGWCTFTTGAREYKWLERKCCACECIIDDWTKVRTIVYLLQ